jgi:hypothetical protein
MYIYNMARCFPYFFVAMLVFVSCESEAEKERARVEREKETIQTSNKSSLYEECKVNEITKVKECKDRKKIYARMKKTGKSFQEIINEDLEAEAKRRSDSSDAICKKDSACRKEAHRDWKRLAQSCMEAPDCPEEEYERRRIKTKEFE